jgi:hypothetical protein
VPKKLKQKKAQVNKSGIFSPEFMYTVDKVFDSTGTSTSPDLNSNSYTSDFKSSWVITDAPVSIEEKIENAGKKFTRKTFKKASGEKIRIKKNKVKFCQTCGNMYEEGLDDSFCSAECKYKYCEIEDEADKHSE